MKISISLLRLSVFLLLGITIIHICATVFYWYWSMSHFDIIMHILGGFWLFIFLSSLFLGETISEYKKILHEKKWILATGIIGVIFGWEMIEWFFDTFIYRQNIWQPFIVDSLKDIIAGLIGVGLAYLFIRHTFLKTQ